MAWLGAAFDDMIVQAKKEHAEKLLKEEQDEQFRLEDERLQAERAESERLEEKRLEAERKADAEHRAEIERVEVIDRRAREEELARASLAAERENLRQSVPISNPEAKKRGAGDLDSSDQDNGHPQKYQKGSATPLDEMEADVAVSETVRDFMDMDCSDHTGSTLKDNANIFDGNTVANRFLDAVSDHHLDANLDGPITGKSFGIPKDTTVPLLNREGAESTALARLTRLYPDTEGAVQLSYSILQEDSANTVRPNFSTSDQLQEVGEVDTTSPLAVSPERLKEWADKEREFKRDLQERVLRKAVADADRRAINDAAELNGESEFGLQPARPMVWGTTKYRDLWAKAAAIDEEMELDSPASVAEESIYEEAEYSELLQTCEGMEDALVPGQSTDQNSLTECLPAC